MCLFKSPNAPPPPEGAEAQRQRRRIAAYKGQYVSPFAVGQSGIANPATAKSLLDR